MDESTRIEVKTQNWDARFAQMCGDYMKDIATSVHKRLVGVDGAEHERGLMREIINWDIADPSMETVPSGKAISQIHGYIHQLAMMGSGMAVAFLAMSVNSEALMGGTNEALQSGALKYVEREDDAE